MSERLAQAIERGRVLVVARDVGHVLDQPRIGVGVDAAVGRQAVPHPRAQPIGRPIRPGDADHRHVQPAVANHGLESGENLLIGEIPGRTKQDESVGPRVRH